MKTLEDFLSRYRLVETNNGDRAFLEEDVVDAIEQAVNEALRMASERAIIKEIQGNGGTQTFGGFIPNYIKVVDKQSILSLSPEIIANLK